MRLSCVDVARTFVPLKLSCVFAAMLASATPVEAQGFLQSLFGWGNNSTSAPQSPAPGGNLGAPSAQPPANLTPGGNAYASGSGRASSQSSAADGDHVPAPSGKVRTVCVRMCDGYYFPVSTSTSRSNLSRDAARCKASCGAEGRIFHMPAGSTDMDAAVDLGGRPYMRTPIAFKYRKTLVFGCQCRPEPWSEAEQERHRIYARNEASDEKAADDAAGEGKSAETTTPEPLTISVARIVTPKPAAVPKQPPQPQQALPQQPAPNQQSAAWSWSWPQQKYTWPGDAPPAPVRR